MRATNVNRLNDKLAAIGSDYRVRTAYDIFFANAEFVFNVYRDGQLVKQFRSFMETDEYLDNETAYSF